MCTYREIKNKYGSMLTFGEILVKGIWKVFVLFLAPFLYR